MHRIAQFLAEKEEVLTKRQLNSLETVLDNLFAKLNIDIEFTRHFLDRVNDTRNKTPITFRELAKLFTDVYKKHGLKISQLPSEAEGVLTDMSTAINTPFIIVHNKRTKMLELINKTVMRKPNFTTKNKRYPV